MDGRAKTRADEGERRAFSPSVQQSMSLELNSIRSGTVAGFLSLKAGAQEPRARKQASGHVYSPTMCTSIDVDDHCARDGFFCSTSASLQLASQPRHAQPDFDRSAQTSFPTNHSLSHSASFILLPFAPLRSRLSSGKVSQHPSRNRPAPARTSSCTK